MKLTVDEYRLLAADAELRYRQAAERRMWCANLERDSEDGEEFTLCDICRSADQLRQQWQQLESALVDARNEERAHKAMLELQATAVPDVPPNYFRRRVA